ncbi:MAG: hypothetical protein EHM85_13015 [Desulfobacteraceae bacterium]|nr:MAG: hypothetical protein EHM85_13015 [Desulfobacteraceae bacterium]
MMDSLRNKWILTGFLWFAVVVITFYNASEIKRLKTAREEMESLRMDEQFWQQHSESISGISEEGNRLFLDIESVDLGLLTIDNLAKKLSSDRHLPPITINRQPITASDGQVPVDISFTGSFADAFRWFQTLDNEMPFLKAVNLKISIDPVSNITVTNGSFFFRYRIIQGDGTLESSGGA